MQGRSARGLGLPHLLYWRLQEEDHTIAIDQTRVERGRDQGTCHFFLIDGCRLTDARSSKVGIFDEDTTLGLDMLEKVAKDEIKPATVGLGRELHWKVEDDEGTHEISVSLGPSIPVMGFTI